MQPNEVPENKRPAEARSTNPEADLPKNPSSSPVRDLTQDCPIELCFHNVSPATLELLLADILPEITPIVAGHLFQTILSGATIQQSVILEGYTDSTRYSITQERDMRFGGGGPAEEISHQIVIERHSEEEPCLFELCLGKRSPRSVDFKISYSSMYEDEKWESIDAFGASIGIESISTLFTNTPPELCEYDDEGDCLSLISGDVSIVTTPASPAVLPVEENPETAQEVSCWVPRAIQVSSPSYSEQTAILSTLAPQLAEALIATGLLPTLDAFGSGSADLRTRLLDKASNRLSGALTIRFSREINVGEPVVSEEVDADTAPEDIDEETFSPSEYDESHELSVTEPDESETSPFSPNPLENPPATSSVWINFDSDTIGLGRLEYFSRARPHGTTMFHVDELFNFAAPVVGLRFVDETPTPQQLAARWGLFGAISRVGEFTIQRHDLEANLLSSAMSPKGDYVSADIGSNRVLMSFDPPRRESESLDYTRET
jgi:hypothetical protein